MPIRVLLDSFYGVFPRHVDCALHTQATRHLQAMLYQVNADHLPGSQRVKHCRKQQSGWPLPNDHEALVKHILQLAAAEQDGSQLLCKHTQLRGHAVRQSQHVRRVHGHPFRKSVKLRGQDQYACSRSPFFAA